MTQALQTIDQRGALQAASQNLDMLSVEEVIQQTSRIQQVMRAVMHEGEHYGVIPGTGRKKKKGDGEEEDDERKSLYKPGAEKLGLVFRLAPRFFGERDPIDMGDGHREYIITCELYSIVSGRTVGSGVGSCSTMESKYRWRSGPKDATGRPVPREYWDIRFSKPLDAQDMLGGPGFVVGKGESGWEIFERGERVPNTDLADQYNTVLKMAKKRAHIDAMLTATAASDIFTQDLEDLEDGGTSPRGDLERKVDMPESTAGGEPVNQPAQQATTAKRAPNGAAWHPSDGQIKRFFAIAHSRGWSDAAWRGLLARHQLERPDDIPSKKLYDEICGTMDKGAPQADNQGPAAEPSDAAEPTGLTVQQFKDRMERWITQDQQRVNRAMQGLGFDGARSIPRDDESRLRVADRIAALFATG